MRAPFQVLVIPFRRRAGTTEFAVLQRFDEGWWQFVAGGGEDQEAPKEAALRETLEEIGLEAGAGLIKLDCLACVPKDAFAIAGAWGPNVYVIPEYCFAVDVGRSELKISREHTELRWASYEEAHRLLRWESNRTGLWELRERIKRSEQDPSALTLA